MYQQKTGQLQNIVYPAAAGNIPAGVTVLVPGVAGQKIRVYRYALGMNAVINWRLEDSAGLALTVLRYNNASAQEQDDNFLFDVPIGNGLVINNYGVLGAGSISVLYAYLPGSF